MIGEIGRNRKASEPNLLLNQIRKPTSSLFDLRWQGLLFSSLMVGGATALLFALKMEAYNVNMVYMLLTLFATVWFGLTAGVITAVLAFLCFDYFFIPPYFTFIIDAFQGWTAVFLFLGTAIFANQIAGRARFNSQQAEQRANEITALYELATAVITEIDRAHMLQTVLAKVSQVTRALNCTLFLADNAQADVPLSRAIQTDMQENLDQQPDLTLAQTSFNRNQAIFTIRERIASAATLEDNWATGQSLKQATASLDKAAWMAYLPLASGSQMLGVMVVVDGEQSDQTDFSPEKKRLLQILASHVALAVEHARLIEETAQMAALRESDKLKSALLASVSHELRTPLTSIKTATANLALPDVSWPLEQRNQFLGVIEQEADRLARLVSNLLDLSKIEAGILKPDFGWYYLPEIVEEVVTRLENNPTLKTHAISTNFGADIPLTKMDYLQVDQVLTNLIENAAKYSPEGRPISIELEVKAATEIQALRADPYDSNLADISNSKTSTSKISLEEAGESDKAELLLVKVMDEGESVPPAELERIFDKFYRVQSNLNRTAGKTIAGTGIGLAISKGIVEAHGGQIWAQNRLYGGTIFYFTLPIVPLVPSPLE